MSTATTLPSPLLTTTASSPSTSNLYKPQHQNQEIAQVEDNDDDVSLAKFMSRKLQVNNQQMATVYPWMSPNVMTLKQFSDPHFTTAADYYPAYGYNVSYIQQQQQQQQHLLLLQQQQQQQQQLQQYYQQHGSTGYSRPSRKQAYPHASGTNHRLSMSKSRSAPMGTHHDPKIRMSSSPSSSKTSNCQRSLSSSRPSTLSSSTSSISSSSYSNSPLDHQRQQRSNSPVPSLVEDSGTWRSSIYSHHSAASSSVKTASDTTTIYSSTSSVSSYSVSKANCKPSLTKRIRGVLTGTNKPHQYPPTSTLPLSLRRSPSLVSCASSLRASENGSFRSSWTNLFRRSSKSIPAAPAAIVEESTNQKESSMHVGRVAPESPAWSVSASSSRHPASRINNNFVVDLPSPASSSTMSESCSTTSTSASSASFQGSNTKQLRHLSSPPVQQDYFGLPSTSHAASAPNSRPISANTATTSLLQQGSPILRPSRNARQNSATSSSSDDDIIPACIIDSQDKKVNHGIITFSNGNRDSKVRFMTTIQVHDTFGSQDYDRRCDNQVTCQRLTPTLALQIKQELNEYKLNDMQVHAQSRQYTHFFL